MYFSKETTMSRTKETTCTVQLLDARELARMLKLSRRQIFRLNSSGKIPAPIRISGSVRWPEATICGWLAAGAPDRKSWDAMNDVGKEAMK